MTPGKRLTPVICIRCQEENCSCPLDPTEMLLECWTEIRRLRRQKALPAQGETVHYRQGEIRQ